MSYPLSSAVSAGQPTAVDHHNNLRLDALYFGQDAADAVPIGSMLERYENNLDLVILSTNRVRVEASPTSPVDLMVYGYPTRSIANVDLPTGSAPSGAAATYYVFAERSDSSTTFSLDCNTSSAEYANARKIGSFYWDGSAIVENSIVTELRSFLVDLLKYAPPPATQGRLTLTTATPITTADVTGGTLYFTPHTGNTVDLYAPGFGWVPHTFTEKSLSFAGLAADTNHDIFINWNCTDVELSNIAWSNATTRATAIALQNGRYVASGDEDYLYLGSVRTSSIGNISDTAAARYLANIYNAVPRSLFNSNTTSHTYALSTVRHWNNDESLTLTEFLLPLPYSPIFQFNESSTYMLSVASASVTSILRLDGSDIIARLLFRESASTNYIHAGMGAMVQDPYFPGIGYHKCSIYESGSATGTATFQEAYNSSKILG